MVEAFDQAEEKAMLINAISEKIPDKYIVAASGAAVMEIIMKSKQFGCPQGYSSSATRKTAAQTGMGLMAPRVGIAAHH